MLHETIQIPAGQWSVAVTTYVPENWEEIDSNRTRPAVVLCPGGAYYMRSRREAEPVALQLLARDLCVFLTEYDVAPHTYPAAVTEVAAVVAHVRANAGKYHVDPNRIVIMGFSAGGHLAGSLGVRWCQPWLSESLGLQPEDIRPNGMVLSYPVLTGGSFTHEYSMECLTGSKDPAVWAEQSLEDLVTDQTAPAFLWHTFEDAVVPVENSLQFYGALRRHGIASELHIYPNGGHGLALSSDLTAGPDLTDDYRRPEVVGWIDMASRWIRNL